MEVKEILEVLDPKLKGYKDEMSAEVEKANKAAEARMKEVNEDLTKKGATLAEIQEKLVSIEAKQGRIGAPAAEAANDFKSIVAKGIADNFDHIKTVSKGNAVKFDVKAVADMTIGNNLTSGSAVITYDLNPAVRGRRLVHFRDIPGVSVIPSATGIWSFYRQSSSVGEGSFGLQTEGSAKAQVDYDNAQVTVNVSYLAGFSRISRQMLTDLPFMQSYVPSELQEDYLRAEDNKFINDLMANTNAYSTTASVYAEKLIEWISAVMARDYNPTSIVSTAANWATLLSTKPADYSIPGGITIDANGNVRVAGIPFLVQNGMTTGKTFVGDFSKAKIIQTDGLSINMFEQDADNVTKNLVTVRAEARVALAVTRLDWGVYA